MAYNEWDIYGLNGCGSYDQVSAVSFENVLKKCCLQGSTFSDHRMATGFGPFELMTCGLLERVGRLPT